MLLLLLACKLPPLPPTATAEYDLSCEDLTCETPDRAGSEDGMPWCSWACVSSLDPEVEQLVTLRVWFRTGDDGCLEVWTWSESDPFCD